MPLKQYFSKVAFSGGHDLSTLAVSDGKADAAFVATHRFMNTDREQGKMKVDDFNFLWSSPLIPQDPFVYRATLCPELKEKIQQTFLTLDQTPEGKKYLENVDSEKFVDDEGLRLRHHPRSRRRQVASLAAGRPAIRHRVEETDRCTLALEVKNLRAGYGEREILKGVSFSRRRRTISSRSSARAAPASRR